MKNSATNFDKKLCLLAEIMPLAFTNFNANAAVVLPIYKRKSSSCSGYPCLGHLFAFICGFLLCRSGLGSANGVDVISLCYWGIYVRYLSCHDLLGENITLPRLFSDILGTSALSRLLFD